MAEWIAEEIPVLDQDGNIIGTKLIKKRELVRCKDCKFYPDGIGATKWLPCREIIVHPNWFCADGERKEVE